MGPYVHGTSHTSGKFFETLYDQPLLMAAAVIVTAGFIVWRLKKSAK
jgi:hypothetical protein